MSQSNGFTPGPIIDAEFPAKLECLFQPRRTKVLYGGRGSAKSWSVARALIIKATQGTLRVLCAREQQNSISESVHKLLGDQITALGFGPIFEIQRDRIICTSTGSTFFFEGIKANVDRIKSYEGVDVCWVEEAHNVSANSWGILIPTIRKPGSEIWITFNPNLETDYTYKNFVLTPDPDTVVVNMNWRDNKWFPDVLRKEMDKLKRTDYIKYLNIWEGQCRVLLEGAVYTNELGKALEENRVCKVPYDPMCPVDTFWDLGWSDKTTIWFRQKVGFEWHYIDYLEGSQKTIAQYMYELQQKPYIYGTMWLPHDAKARQLGTGSSIEERMRKVFRVRLVKRLSLEDGIDAARTMFPLCWFDKVRCAEGIKSLGAYRYEVLEEKGILSKVPVHDWSSHGADSFRYSGVSLTQGRSEAAEKRAKTLGDALNPHLGRGLGEENWGFGSGTNGNTTGTGWMR
jgi:phage terminase large subunit